jgi:Ni,Fe-hydrogenase III small subunit/formate hydrogenlyase subunit 6/NADH:ubiquinone oxidoreductase subunit I
MIRAFAARVRQGYKTNDFPHSDPKLTARYLGRPEIKQELCDSCGQCEKHCPTGAISAPIESVDRAAESAKTRGLSVDLGLCVFCGECARACPKGAIRFSGSFRMGARDRAGLLVSSEGAESIEKLDASMLSKFGRSMKFRVVSAGGCNACESDINVLETIGFDLSRFGLSYTASPRHADGLIVVGPVSVNMEGALLETWEAMSSPKIAIAVGTCAISGGLFKGLPDVCDGAAGIIPIDLFIPGCPPHPMTILNGLLEVLNRIPDKMTNQA